MVIFFFEQVKPDGKCLVNAILQQVVHHLHKYTAEMCMRQVGLQMLKHPHCYYKYIETELIDTRESYESYCYNVYHGNIWGDDLIASVIGDMWNIAITRMDNSSTVTYTEDNYIEPILPDNPIRYSETKNYNMLTFAPSIFVISILLLYLLRVLLKGILNCIQNIRMNRRKKQNTKIVAEMTCKECEQCAGSLFCTHKITPV